MPASLDHLVLRMRDEAAMLAFYTDVLGFEGERLEAYRAGEVFFPSIRIDASTVIDLFPTQDADPTTPNLDHFCITLDRGTWESTQQRLTERGVDIDGPHARWGARGDGPSIYVSDPDGNTVELKTYD